MSTSPSSPSPILIHFLGESRAESTLWLLEELGVDYRIKYWRREPSGFAPKGLRNVHPLGKSPVIEHDGQVIAETGNIIAYLLKTFPTHAEKFTTFANKEAEETNSYFMYYTERSLMPLFVVKFIVRKFAQLSESSVRPVVEAFASSIDKTWINDQLLTHLEMIGGFLKKSTSGWVAGGDEPSGADFGLLYPFFLIESGLSQVAGGAGSQVPCPESVKQWVEKAQSRPKLKSAFEKLALAEKEYDAQLERKKTGSTA